MMPEKDIKTYVAKSKIDEAGKGLFAKCLILPGEVVAVFEEEKDEKFRDYAITHGHLSYNYDHNCDANFANDIVNVFSLKNIYDNILNGKSIIEKHENLELNGLIQNRNDPKFEMVIIATKNIYPDEEIYIHYGLQYWLSWRQCRRKFTLRKFFDPISNKNENILSFPKCINESENARQSISNYVKTFFDQKSQWEILDQELRIFFIDGIFKHENVVILPKISISDSISIYHSLN